MGWIARLREDERLDASRGIGHCPVDGALQGTLRAVAILSTTELPEPVTRRSPNQLGLRGLIVAGCLALAWWAVWLFDPRNLGSTVLFAVVAAAQVLDLLAVLGFWHAVWPRKPSEAVFAPVRGRASILVIAHGQPVEMVEETLQAALSVRRRNRVFLADPFERPDLQWLPGWHGVTRLSPGLDELNELVGARFIALFEAGQVPRPDFLEQLLPYFADRNLGLVQAWYSRSGKRRSRVRDAIFRGSAALGDAPCIGSNYVLRRTALQSVGGFGPDQLSLAGALRLATALGADRWRTLYVGAPLADSLGAPGPVSRLADYYRWTAAELATTSRRAGRRRASAGAGFHAAWMRARHLALIGLPVSAVALAGAAAVRPVPLAWAANLAIHLGPYLVLRTAIRVVVGASRPADVPALEEAPDGPWGMEDEGIPPETRPASREAQPAESLRPQAADIPPAEPELEPAAMAEVDAQLEPLNPEPLRLRLSEAAATLVTSELFGALQRITPALEPLREPVEAVPAPDVTSEVQPTPMVLVDTTPEVAEPLEAAAPEPLSDLQTAWDEPPAPEPQPLRRRTARPALAVAAAAWVVTAGAIGAAAYTVIQSNPPQHATLVEKVTAPPYSYYVPRP
jgi:Glycosyl transferase family 21